MGFLANIFEGIGNGVSRLLRHTERKAQREELQNYVTDEQSAVYVGNLVRLKLSKEARTNLNNGRRMLNEIASAQGIERNDIIAYSVPDERHEYLEVDGKYIRTAEHRKRLEQRGMTAVAIQQDIDMRPVLCTFKQLLDTVNRLDMVPATLPEDRRKSIARYVEKFAKQLGSLPLQYQQVHKLGSLVEQFKNRRDAISNRPSISGKNKAIIEKLDERIKRLVLKTKQFGYKFIVKSDQLLEICDKITSIVTTLDVQEVSRKIEEEATMLLEGEGIEDMDIELEMLSDETDAMLDAALTVDEDTESAFAKFEAEWAARAATKQLRATNETAEDGGNSDGTSEQSNTEEHSSLDEVLDAEFEVMDD